jgi:hypothetical protein
MQVVLGWLGGTERSLGARRTLGGLELVLCHSAGDVARQVSQHDVACIVVDPLLAMALIQNGDPRQVLAGSPIILRSRLSPASANAIVAVASVCNDGCISLIGIDDLDAQVVAVAQSALSPSADLAIVNESDGDRPHPLRHAIVAAAAIGRGRAAVSDLARAMAVPVRTLQWRIASRSGLSTSDLLAWSVAIHTLWRLDVLAWPLKRCASAAGFSDANGLSAFVRRHVGQTPRELHRAGGFHGLLGRWHGLR